MEPIVINVQVNFGVSRSLCDLISAVASRMPAALPELPEAGKPEETKKEAAVKTEPAAPEVKPEPETRPVVHEEPASCIVTEVDVRAAMDRTRKRIEGEDWKENTDSEGYKQWHRKLNAWFKKTAVTYGAEKPSTLPDSEARSKFIAECDALYVKDGKLDQDLPF